MQFTRLRLNGFKSFVDPTDLVIAPGLTGVVGPNGCGKSNLLEALRWVMGETRPSAVRGGGMEDVIFAGAATRNARNFAEVTLQIDNSDRLAPASLNDRDMVEVVRRITRDAGSAYKANGKEVRARDVQMLFADASTGATSPALVRQGQISELINAKPKSRRRVLEEAAGISGLYQRRHEAELKLKSTEANLERVDDVVEQLAAQLAQLTRQAKQAARYREIGEQLRAAEGLLLFRRWQDADRALVTARQALTERVTTASRAEAEARAAGAARSEAEDSLPALREEEAIAAALLQRAMVERDSLAERARAAEAEILRLEARLADYAGEAAREDGLSEDAEAMQARLAEEAEALEEAASGHDEALDLAAGQAEEAAEALALREEAMQELTEAVATLSARHQAVARLVSDNRRVLDRETAEAAAAAAAVAEAEAAAETGAETCAAAEEAAQAAAEALELAEEEAHAAEEARGAAQGEEAAARGAASEAEGEAKALRAEVAGLERLVARDGARGGQILDELTAAPGFERALGAALADDLKAPRLAGDLRSGWARLEDYDSAQPLPAGAAPLAAQVTGCDLLGRRLGQVGVIDAADGPRLQPWLRPGQRLVSREGDLWRWDGLVAAAADAPSAAALRLEQQNRLTALSADLEEAEARAEAARILHDTMREALRAATTRETALREARKRAETQLSEASRAQTRAEADRNLAASRVEALGLAAARHREAAEAAEAELSRAEATRAGLEDLEAARARAEAEKTVVEAARLAMLARRAALDETRRDGEARA
ncbi:AAA family ATPase, partial [Mangrovicoccus algicola]|nr:AAA family ATPase [Mangrovicoccus algicola]